MQARGAATWAAGAPKHGERPIDMIEAVQHRGSLRQAPRWPVQRVEAVESLWGPGYVGPGGAEETLRLSRPLGLSDKSVLLLLGGGLGGPALTVSHSYQAWVNSYEADPILAALAEERRPVLDLHQRTTAQFWVRDRPAFGLGTAHHIMSLEALRGAAPAPVIRSLAGALLPMGHIVLTELVAERQPPETDREFGAWCRLENRLPRLPRVDDISLALRGEQFEVRGVEDISERHVSQTIAGWRTAVKAMAANARPAAAAAAAFVNEAELWLLRIRLMRRLDLKLVRWHAQSMNAAFPAS